MWMMKVENEKTSTARLAVKVSQITMGTDPCGCLDDALPASAGATPLQRFSCLGLYATSFRGFFPGIKKW
jgi:hypothetical protein